MGLLRCRLSVALCWKHKQGSEGGKGQKQERGQVGGAGAGGVHVCLCAGEAEELHLLLRKSPVTVEAQHLFSYALRQPLVPTNAALGHRY